MIKEMNKKMDVDFDSNGNYSVQVEAWRSKRKAQGQVGKWKKRGFNNSFVIKYEGKKPGDVWFRVRLGRLSVRQSARNLQDKLKTNYDAASWISSIR